MSSNFLVTAVAAVSLVAFSASGFTEEAIKGSKSDTSERMGGGGGVRTSGAAKTTTVKSSKSNGSERMGGGGGRSGGGAAAKAKNLNTSRSNVNRSGGRDTKSPGTR